MYLIRHILPHPFLTPTHCPRKLGQSASPLLPVGLAPKERINKESNRVSLPLQVCLTPLLYFYSAPGISLAIKSKAMPSLNHPAHPSNSKAHAFTSLVITLASCTHPSLKGLPRQKL